MNSTRFRILLIAALAVSFDWTSASAQLQIVEVLPSSVDNNNWEWIEVRNAGTTDLDLDGYIFDDDDGAPRTAANIDSFLADNTVVPAESVAVLYDGFGLNYDDDRFRAAWNLPSTTPVIAVDFWPSLSGGGDPLGIWPSLADYENDLITIPGPDEVLGTDDDGLDVGSTNNAVAAVNYGADGFPNLTGTHSLAWSGNGSPTDGAQWASTYNEETMAPISPAVTSITTNLPGGTAINSDDDTGNPGRLSPFAQSQTGVVITEIMYNPASSESTPRFEWVEVYNNSGSTIDFSDTPFVFDDDDGGALEEANVTEGSIANGETAILFNGEAITAEELAQGWGSDINFIGITEWSGLSNAGDTIGLWDGLDSYGDQDFDSAVSTVAYDDDGSEWPSDNGASSIHLTTNTTAVEPWAISEAGDGFSDTASPIISGAVADHPGGDVGSPGTFTIGTPGGGGGDLTCDFDADGDCEQDDINALFASGDVSLTEINEWLEAASTTENSANTDGRTFVQGDVNLDGNVDSTDLGLLLNNFNSTSTLDWANGNLNDDGAVNSTDLGLLLNNFGSTSASASTVPEPGGFGMLVLAALGIGFATRRRR